MWPKINSSSFSVIGHMYPDLDSMASAYATAALLGGEAATVGDIEPFSATIWKNLGGPLLPNIVKGNIVIVDCSVPAIQKNVLLAIDHHREPATNAYYPIVWAKRGATATIVAEEGIKSLTKEAKILLAAAVLSDTKVLMAKRTTAYDKRILPMLYKNWRDLIGVVFPPSADTPVEVWKKSGLKVISGVKWAAGEGWGDPPNIEQIGSGEDKFIFSWVNLHDKTVTVVVYKDGIISRIIDFDRIVSRTNISDDIIQML